LKAIKSILFKLIALILLEKFRIAPKYHFYETRLLYKEEKFKYWIFQFPIDYFLNINYEKSFYSIPDENILLNFKNREEFLAAYKEEFRKTKKNRRKSFYYNCII